MKITFFTVTKKEESEMGENNLISDRNRLYLPCPWNWIQRDSYQGLYKKKFKKKFANFYY